MALAWEPSTPLAPGLPAYPAEARALEAPAEALCSLNDQGLADATLALWPPDGMRAPDGAEIARIGRYAASSPERGAALLDEACARLAELGARRAVGPMNGSTWFSYRLVSDPGDNAPFLLEPWSTPADLAAFAQAGFTPAERYVSVATDALPSLEEAQAAQAHAQGVVFETVSPESYDAALADIGALSLRAFAPAPYFAPIDPDRLAALYAPARALTAQGFTTLARRDDQLAGFMFAYLGARASAERALILKTIAVDPHAGGHGVGKALTMRALAQARAAGLTTAIFATMHEANLSASWAGGRGEVVRRYTLFAREL